MSMPFTMMQNGTVLGRVAGITINANQSALFLALILALNLFPIFGISLASLIMVPMIIVLFMASLLAHELGHALTARQFGIQTEAITLHGLGGVAKITGEPKTPGEEFWVAIAGPAVSLFLAGFFFVLDELTYRPIGMSMLNFGLHWLWIGNLALAIFNMFPGLPLDGGRVFRAAVWRATMSRKRGTIAAARGGETIGLLIYALAFLRFLSGDLIGAVFTGVMGWFLRSAARTERMRAQMQGRRPDGASNFFDFIRTMQTNGRTRRPRGFGMGPTPSSRAQGHDSEEEVVHLDDGREVYIRKK